MRNPISIDPYQSPSTWISLILEACGGRFGDFVEQQLVGAVLARRFGNVAIPNDPGHTAIRRAARAGDFVIARSAYHVTTAPSRKVLIECANNITSHLQPILLVPREQREAACVLAQEQDIDKQVIIFAIEDFIASHIFFLAGKENKDCLEIFETILHIYDRRLAEIDTNFSLNIALQAE